MKKHFTYLILLLLIACKSETNKNTSETVQNEPKKEVAIESNPNADFSSLFETYNCDMSITELAEVLQIPAADIVLADNPSNDKCVFQVQGFGKGYENSGSRLRFGPSFSTKGQNKKVITEHLKEKKERPQGMIMGRDIILADAGQCYITLQLLQGRVIILNENYEQLFMITYGNLPSVQERSKEQHDELTKKVIDLANYLVSKHKN